MIIYGFYPVCSGADIEYCIFDKSIDLIKKNKSILVVGLNNSFSVLHDLYKNRQFIDAKLDFRYLRNKEVLEKEPKKSSITYTKINDQYDVEKLLNLEYDYLFIESSTGMSYLTRELLNYADYVLMPTPTEEYIIDQYIKYKDSLKDVSAAYLYKNTLIVDYNRKPNIKAITKYNEFISNTDIPIVKIAEIEDYILSIS